MVRTKEYVRVVGELASALARCGELAAQHRADQVSIDWLRHRVNQLEKERAILLREVTHLAIPTPEIATDHRNTMTAALPDGFSMPSFEDVGDQMAERMGIKHDPEGHTTYQ